LFGDGVIHGDTGFAGGGLDGIVQCLDVGVGNVAVGERGGSAFFLGGADDVAGFVEVSEFLFVNSN
jgi:hypothetical protein